MAMQSFPTACVVFVSFGLVCDGQQWNMPLLLRELNNEPPILSELGQVMLETKQLEGNGLTQNISLVSLEPQRLGPGLVRSAKPEQFQPTGYLPVLLQPEPAAQGSNTLELKKPALAQGLIRNTEELSEIHKLGQPREHSKPQRPVIESPLGSEKRQMLETNQRHHSHGFRDPLQGPNLTVVTGGSETDLSFEHPEPERPQTVVVECRESSVHVQVHRDLLGNGQLIKPADLTLGGCQAAGYNNRTQILVFESALEGCSSKVTITEDGLIYAFSLQYNPSPLLGTSIVRTNGTAAAVQCVYPRKHNVSSNSALMRTWTPHASNKETEEVLIFSLHLMSDDWQSERPSSIYFLGDVMNVEASVLQSHHGALRVFADSCVATAGPDIDALPRYSFIENYGCFTDAQETRSKSQYFPRVQDNKLQFQLRTFRFHQQDTNSIYITCHLKAASSSIPTDSAHKGCSFSAARNSWLSADGRDVVCDCCDSNCAARKGRSLTSDGLRFQGKASIGPITVQDGPVQETLEASPEIEELLNFSIEEMVLGGIIAAVVLVCLMTLGSILYQRLKSTVLSCVNT